MNEISHEADGGVRVGMAAPDFTLPQASGHSPITLSSLRGQPVVLAFSAPEWDPARGEELAQYNRLLSRSGLGGELLGLSRDGIWCQAAFAEGQERFPLLTDTDPNGGVAQIYGVAGRQALFLVDANGIVRWAYTVSSGAPAGTRRLEEALRALASDPEAPPPEGARRGLTRREFVAAALAAVTLTLPGHGVQAQATPAAGAGPEVGTVATTGTVPVTLRVNGTAHTLQIEPRVTLLDALRERLALTGSKKGCDQGQCGACTVHVDGRRVNACLTLAIACQGKAITTIEGLAQGETLHPMQAAFIQHDGFQCGYCTPGQIMSAVALIKEPIGPTDAEVRENMSGNLCRCGAYPNIVAAVQEVRKGGDHASV